MCRFTTLALPALLAGIQSAPSGHEPVLHVGDRVEGRIEASDAPIHSSLLDRRRVDAVTRGREFALEVGPGSCTIELVSHLFDAYLVLRDAEGAVLAEDDDGLVNTQARLVFGRKEASRLTVIACALHGMTGPFELRVVSGVPSEESPDEHRERAIEDARRTVSARESECGRENAPVAFALDTLAMLLEDAGKHDEARLQMQRALRIRERVSGPASPELARSLNNFGLALAKHGHLEEARQLLDRARAMAEDSGDPENAALAVILKNLADVLHRQGRLADARPMYERVLAIREKQIKGDSGLIAGALNDLGHLTFNEGRFEDARALLERAVAMAERTLRDDDPDKAQVLQNLAQVLHGELRLEEACPLLERALHIRERRPDVEPRKFSQTLVSLGALYRDVHREDEARVMFERSLAAAERSEGPDGVDVAVSLNNLSLLQQNEGDLAGALRSSARALAICERTLGPNHRDTAVSLNNFASALQRSGACEEARPLFERSIEIARASFGTRHPEYAKALANLCLLLLDLGDPAGALSSASAALDVARAHAAQELRFASEDRALRSISLEASVLMDLASCARGSRDPSARRAVHEAAAHLKGAVFRLSRARRAADAKLVTEEARRANEDLRVVDAELSSLLADPGDLPADELAQRMKTLRERRESLESSLTLVLPRDMAAEEAITTPALASALGARGALIEFLDCGFYSPALREAGRVVRAGRWDAAHVLAFVHRSGMEAPEWIDLGPASAIDTAIRDALEELSTERGVSAVSTAGARSGRSAAAARLFELVWAPLAAWIGDAKTVWVCPDGALGTLPFGVLQEEDGHYLLERHSFAWLVETSALLRRSRPVAATSRVSESSGPSLLAVGGVDYHERANASHDAPTTAAGRAAASYFGPLSLTRAEAEGVADLHGRRFPDASRLVLEDADATEERLKLEMPHFQMLHLATHGYFAPDSVPSALDAMRSQGVASADRIELAREHRLIKGYWPELLCGLVCSGANEIVDGRDDGRLTAEEVHWLDLSGCDLVVLSACQTAVGTPRAGEGMASLTYSFLAAGAKTVVSSLWSVRDDSAKELMLGFYRNLWEKREGPVVALREAQLELLRKNRGVGAGNGRPSTWGAFILTGSAN